MQKSLTFKCEFFNKSKMFSFWILVLFLIWEVSKYFSFIGNNSHFHSFWKRTIASTPGFDLVDLSKKNINFGKQFMTIIYKNLKKNKRFPEICLSMGFCSLLLVLAVCIKHLQMHHMLKSKAWSTKYTYIRVHMAWFVKVHKLSNMIFL